MLRPGKGQVYRQVRDFGTSFISTYVASAGWESDRRNASPSDAD
jgi:hypothetical protein